MTDPDARLASDLSLAVVRLARQLRFRRPDSPVSLSQLSALATLAKEGPMTPGALALRERVKPPSMTRVIASLADVGFVDRRAHPDDGRQVLVSVSSSGQELIEVERRRQPGMASATTGGTPTRTTQYAAGGCRSDCWPSWMKAPERLPDGRLSDGSVIDVHDPTDPRLDDFRDLNSIDRRPDLPSGKGLVIAEGVLVVQRMLASRFTPVSFLGNDRRLGELAKDLPHGGAPFYRASAEVMAEVIGFHLNRGVLAAAKRPPELTVHQVLEGARTIAVLEGVNDHENLGSMFRNAAGLDVDAILFGTGCADPLYRRAVRVSMGHALLVPYASSTNWPGDVDLLRDNGFRIIAMTPNPAAATLAEAMAGLADDKVAILVGAEGPGLTERTMRASDVRVRIPMTRGTDSLNVATAAALAFYERARG